MNTNDTALAAQALVGAALRAAMGSPSGKTLRANNRVACSCARCSGHQHAEDEELATVDDEEIAAMTTTNTGPALAAHARFIANAPLRARTNGGLRPGEVEVAFDGEEIAAMTAHLGRR